MNRKPVWEMTRDQFRELVALGLGFYAPEPGDTELVRLPDGRLAASGIPNAVLKELAK